MNGVIEKARPSSPIRRLLQISLRALLVLVAVCSVWLGIAFHCAREQARIVAAIESNDGYVYYDYHRADPIIRGDATSSVPAWLLNALGVDFFHEVIFVDADQVTDDILSVICELLEIRRLNLGNSTITNDGLSHLQSVAKLESLSINSPQIDDQGLAAISELRQLEDLVMFVDVTDSGVEPLSKLKRLKRLWLFETRITRQAAELLANAYRIAISRFGVRTRRCSAGSQPRG